MKPFKTMFNGKVHNICAMAETAKCHEGCLVSAGRGQMSSVQRGRERKTLWYLSDRVGFMDALHNDIAHVPAAAGQEGYLALCAAEWHQ